ncbi:MAG: diaminopimelate epimerase [Thermovirgaceae bacterium]
MNFAKMQGNGNDFIIIDNQEGLYEDVKIRETAVKACRRRLSLGADGLMTVGRPSEEGSHFAMRFYNRDGSESAMSGNGARCIARYAYEKGIAPKNMRFDTIGGALDAIVEGARVTLDTGTIDTSLVVLDESFSHMGEMFPVNHMELGHGNEAAPHTVVFLEKSDWRPLETLAPFARALQKDTSRFPDGTNVNFLKILGHGALEVYTYERGVDDFTLSCGSGSIAAAVAAWLNGWCDSPVDVYNPGGTNTIIMEETSPSILRIRLEGVTAFIAEGSLYPDGL